MFAYDSNHDEYNEVFEQNYNETNELKVTEGAFRKGSIRSSTSSFRSNNNHWNFIKRIISKTGRQNIHLLKLPNKNLVYFKDLGNTLLNIRWRWILITVCLVNFISFYFFGVLWMWLAYISGDFDENVSSLCVVNTKNLTGYILLSIETMQTIGYGYRYPTEKCIQGWILPFLQALVSVGIQGVLVSAIYVKISKPFTKNSQELFSKKAVIYLRDSKLCFIIRITDLVGKVSVGTNITMYFVEKDATGIEADPFYIQQIKVEPHGFLIFPLEIMHTIDAQSPLWNITPTQLVTKRIEIIVVAEGSSLVTGQISQNRTSYKNSDILWGHRFASCIEFNNNKGKYLINYKNLNKMFPIDIPLCSAQELSAIESGFYNS